jgi:outer membrane protein assembly factor BamB
LWSKSSKMGNDNCYYSSVCRLLTVTALLQGQMQAASSDTGNLLWSRAYEGCVGSSALGAAGSSSNGLLYYGIASDYESEDYNFYAVYAANGSAAWSHACSSPMGSLLPALGHSGRVYAASAQRDVYAFEALTGALLGTYTNSLSFVEGGITSIATDPQDEGSALFLLDARYLHAIDGETMELSWESDRSLTNGKNLDRSPPVFGHGNGLVYAQWNGKNPCMTVCICYIVCRKQSFSLTLTIFIHCTPFLTTATVESITAFRAADGAVVWETPINYPHNFNFYGFLTIDAGNVLYVPADSDWAVLLDGASGGRLHSIAVKDAVYLLPDADQSTNMVYISGYRKVFAYQLAAGTSTTSTPLWAVELDAELSSTLTMDAQGVIYFTDEFDTTFALNKADGSVLWAAEKGLDEDLSVVTPRSLALDAAAPALFAGACGSLGAYNTSYADPPSPSSSSGGDDDAADLILNIGLPMVGVVAIAVVAAILYYKCVYSVDKGDTGVTQDANKQDSGVNNPIISSNQ